jgi:hypothetical protein
MNCCTNCFKDKEVIGFIFSNTIGMGNCDYCKSTDVELLDPRELEEMFLPIIGIYQTVAELAIVVEDEKKLYEKIQSDWSIFNLRSVRARNQLIKDIVAGTFPPNHPLFNEPVEIAAIHAAGLDAEFHEKKWESFADEIKSANRYFLKETIDLALLAKLLRVLEKTYSRGKIFYRARISPKEGLPKDELGKPPAEKSTSGRANPKGIPYLYVSATQKTTEYESRSSYLDYLTVGTFKLLENLSVISLRNTQNISPFVLEDGVENYVVHQKYLARLEKELSKPVRRFDKELDYLPTQYLCEYVKSLGYDAIEYGSALHKGGINLAIFNDAKIECKFVEVYEVDSMELHLEKVTP